MENLLASILGIISNPTFWGIIIGASFSLGGVYLTNYANDRRLREQLQHDRELKNRERELSLRKEIYLASAEAIHAGLIAIGRFSHLEVPDDKLTDEYLSKASSMAKVHIVGKKTTVKSLLQFSGEFAAAFLRLSVKRVPLSKKMNEISALDDLDDTFAKEQSRILELMNHHNLEGSNDQRKSDLLQNRFDFETQRRDENFKKRDALAATLYLETLSFMEECAEERLRLWHLAVPVVVSAREELDLPLDKVEYADMVEEAIAKQMNEVKEFGKQIQSHVDSPPTI
jgi:hypothetical protein